MAALNRKSSDSVYHVEFIYYQLNEFIVSVLPSGLCPDWETWDPSQPVENAREAMQQADDWLGVPQVRLT